LTAENRINNRNIRKFIKKPKRTLEKQIKNIQNYDKEIKMKNACPQV
jgi:hypothetical protein